MIIKLILIINKMDNVVELWLLHFILELVRYAEIFTLNWTSEKTNHMIGYTFCFL